MSNEFRVTGDLLGTTQWTVVCVSQEYIFIQAEERPFYKKTFE